MSRYKPVRQALDSLVKEDALETVLQKTAPGNLDSLGKAGKHLITSTQFTNGTAIQKQLRQKSRFESFLCHLVRHQVFWHLLAPGQVYELEAQSALLV